VLNFSFITSVCIIFSLSSSIHRLEAQSLGGYPLKDTLLSATHPNGCNTGYILNFLNYSVWANLNSNTFTPDKNSNNDLFLPIFSCESIFEYELKIYDKWGKDVFKISNIKQG